MRYILELRHVRYIYSVDFFILIINELKDLCMKCVPLNRHLEGKLGLRIFHRTLDEILVLTFHNKSGIIGIQVCTLNSKI